jgi:hypothetical protein
VTHVKCEGMVHDLATHVLLCICTYTLTPTSDVHHRSYIQADGIYGMWASWRRARTLENREHVFPFPFAMPAAGLWVGARGPRPYKTHAARAAPGCGAWSKPNSKLLRFPISQFAFRLFSMSCSVLRFKRRAVRGDQLQLQQAAAPCLSIRTSTSTSALDRAHAVRSSLVDPPPPRIACRSLRCFFLTSTFCALAQQSCFESCLTS